MTRIPAPRRNVSAVQQLTNSQRTAGCLVGTILLAVIVLFCINGQTFAASAFKREKLTLVTTAKEYVFNVELAETSEQQSRGLMFRHSLGPREGMLFLHPEPRYISMWMRNTYIPLDMIFIRADGRIHRIEARTEPLSERIIQSGDRVTAVLEIAGGLSQRLGLKAGDLVRHSHFSQ